MEAESTTNDPSNPKPNLEISFPTEIIEDILSRLPAKSILQFQSVSKPWRSIISDPSFSHLHFSRSGHLRSGLFLSAYDPSANKRYFLSASHSGGSVAHFATLANVPPSSAGSAESEHLNGLVCFSSANGSNSSNYAFVVNPSTRKVVKIPDSVPWSSYGDGESNTCYLFGFHESRNEHKVLNIRIKNYRSYKIRSTASSVIDVLLFSMSDRSWRNIDAKLPIDKQLGRSRCIIKCSVCVKSAIHFMINGLPYELFTFDLTTERFSKIRAPDYGVPHEFITTRVVKIDGCVGIVCNDIVRNEMHIWMLQDFERRVWVRETVRFSEIELSGGSFPLDYVDKDEMIFFSRRLSRNTIGVYMYSVKNRCFKLVQFALSQPFLCLDDVVFDDIKCYVESIRTLERNWNWNWNRTRTW